MTTILDRINHYKSRIKNIWHLRNKGSKLEKSDVRGSIWFNIRRAKEYGRR